MSDITGTIVGWTVHRSVSGSYYITGTLVNDQKGRFPEDTYIRTSHLRSVDFVEGIAETLNSTYRLA